MWTGRGSSDLRSALAKDEIPVFTLLPEGEAKINEMIPKIKKEWP